MKKSRFLSFLLTVALVFSLSVPYAGAYHSDIVDAMHVDAKAALLVELDSDMILYEQNAYERVYPASITKVMTALLVLEAVDNGVLSLDDVITAGPTTWQGLDESSSNQKIQVGEQLSVQDLLYCLMVASANEAANVLAVAVSGSIENFVDRMNERAEELGCTGTNFVNPDGMPSLDHYTTAYDLYLIAKEAMKNETFCSIAATTECYIEPTNMTETQRHFFNTNGLLSNKKYQGYMYPYATGIKTGSTSDAGYCLLSSAERDGRSLICVMMGCENPTDSAGTVQRLQFSESSRLLDWGFKNFSTHTILDSTDPVAEVPVTLSSECDYISVVVDGTLDAFLPNDVIASDFEWTTELPESVEAPIQAGDKIGTLTLTLEGEEYGSVDLVAVNDVERSQVLVVQRALLNVLHHWPYFVLGLVVLAILVFLLFRLSRAVRRRRRYSGRPGQGTTSYRGKRGR